MGIFSSKTVVTAGVSVSHLVDENPNVMRDSVITSVMTGRPISDVILSNGVRGFATKVEKYYQFGKTNYSVGLPSGSTLEKEVDPATVKTILDSLVGSPITINTLNLSNANLDFLAWNFIDDEYGFDFDTKKFLTPVVPASTREFFYVGQTITPGGMLSVEYYSTAPSTPNQTGYVTVVIPGYNAEELYYNVEYKITSDATEKKYFWVYKMSSNTYPILSIATVVDEETSYLPIITLRSSKENLVGNAYGEEYATAKKMAFSIGIDIVDVTEKLMSTENGNDPNVIDSAFLVFAANVQSENKSTIKYLYKYLKAVTAKATTDAVKWQSWITGGKQGDAPVNMIDITDGKMRTTIFYNYAQSKMYSGAAGKPGSLTRQTTVKPAEGEIEYSELKFIKQIDETNYEEFIIYGLKHVSHAYPGEIVIRTLEDSLKINENLKPEGGFFFPVSRSIAMQISGIDRSTLYMDSLAIVIYTVQITKVKWYQRKFFRVLLVIIAVVYAVYTTDWSQVTTALAALQAAANVIVTLIINSLTVKALALAAGILGSDLAAIVTTLVALYAVYSGALKADPSVPWAGELLKTTMLSYQGIQVDIQQDFLDTQRDFADFIKSEQEKLADLKEKVDNFSPDLDLLYLTSTSYYFDPYETPSQFYQRSVENKNPGVISFDALSAFFDIKLTLPKLNA